MNILILSGSPRKGGNTDLLVEAFVKGASQRNHVEVVSVRDYKVNPCMGCNACFKSKENICAQKDDMSLIYEKMNHADMLVIASPVYFYELSAQLKAVIDRCHNPIRDTFRIKKMALLLVGAATLPELFDSILSQYQLCLNFFKLEDAGHVLVRGVKDKGDIKNTNALNEAFKLAQSIHILLRYPTEDKMLVRFGFVIVDDSKRGKGYGKQLLRLAIDFAQRELSAQKITLGVFCDNQSAVECYKSVGFRITGNDSYLIDGEKWKGYEMEIELKKK